ncbi:MAG: hypothetical protein HGA23_00285 [Bacteroidales bacterium]|nr:hypothetical protein [Bacteroidales bacterium]
MNKIDNLFREAMTGYKAEPSLGLWLRIERRFFPPSKFRPSGLITSILLLSVAGLMPWILIPANDQAEKEPNLPEGGNTRRGYLIQTVTPEETHRGGSSTVDLSERTFSIKPTVYLANPADPVVDPSSQFIASIMDPAEDPALQPLLQAYQNEYHRNRNSEPATSNYSAIHWIYRMRSYSAGFLNEEFFKENISSRHADVPNTAFTPDYENDYFKNGEFSAALNFNPSIIFYDPNPYNKILGGEAVIHYKKSSFSVMSGLGFSRAEDIASYKVNYISNDSVGYYLRVVSFIPDPRNPGNVTYIVTQEAIYDSVPHYTIADKTNYYSYIDIPLSFGYTFFQKNRIFLTASVGIKFSFLVAEDEPQVDFWISEAELVDIERQIPARMNTNWRFTAGVDFGYLFTEKFSFHLEPVFEQYISPIYVEQAGYNPRKPYVTGLKAGIRYNF